MNYINVATTVFTPLEYGAIGYAEEDAKAKYGAENIRVYQSLFKPLEWAFSDEREEDSGFCKLICDKT
jgi:thioredoxin reductase (NADPH)